MMKHTRNRAVSAALVLATGVIGIAGGVLAPAASAETAPQILVSADGVRFSTALSVNLFDGFGALIPGGSQSATLWAKNPTSSPVVVRLSATDVTVTAPDFAASVTMTTSNSADGRTASQPLSMLRNCDVVIDSTPLAAGETVAMTVTFTMADVTGLVAQDEHASLNLRVGMRDATVGAFPASACDDNGVVIGVDPDQAPTPGATSAHAREPLAHTGLDAAPSLLIVGGLVVGGVFLVIMGRHRTRDRRRNDRP